jgi:homoserine dehydrogenase
MRNIRKGTGESRRGKETILLILDSAKSILIEEGYSKLSMRKVALGAQISVGNLQYYYPNKNDLLKDMLDHSIDEFMAKLPSLDADFNARIEQAASEGKVLRYVGTIKEGHCKVGIEAVDSSHALNVIRDGENALAILSQYYQPRPFVIRGYGAGSEVTAAGVFADVLKTLSR